MSDHYDGPACPVPISDYPNILMAHGGGGKLMHRLIDDIFAAAFDNPRLETSHDGAVIDLAGRKIAFTTDSYVVHPLVFPGGDIGSLAINGTVNDLAMCGARPQYISCGFILEEGLPIETLWHIAQSMRRAAATAGVVIVTGDTKVVDRGRGHGVYINTAGIGSIEHDLQIGPKQVVPGDVILLSGDIGRHGVAIMGEREGLTFETTIESDCAPLVEPVMSLLGAGIDIHCLRDLTRGGLATSLVEIARTSQTDMYIEENAVPIHDAVRGACEILGLDPLYVANEGRFIAVVAEDDADRALDNMRSTLSADDPRIIGRAGGKGRGMVTAKSILGVDRLIDMLSGEQLPRIC